jgi:hypothetical protein
MPATEEQAAALRGDIDRQVMPVILDLAELVRHGALGGVAEVIAERRRQVEQGATARQDDRLAHGELVAYAERRIRLGKLRQAAALLAAEIDRLNRAETAS